VTLAPTPPAERDAAIDALRGAALFGVLLENVQHFAQPSYAVLAASAAASAADRLGLAAIRLFCDHKVYCLFALLFGYGIALQLARAERERAGFAALHVWRMACLFLIGIANLLLWSGDILSTYAVLGAALWPLRRASDAALQRLAAGLLAAPALLVALLFAASGAAASGPVPLEARVAEWLYPLRQACFAFAMFALGLAAGRRGLLSDAAALARARGALPLAFGVGLAGNLAFAAIEAGRPAPFSAGALAREATLAVAAPALAFAYAVAVLSLARAPRHAARLAPLAAVGRATLSNYLLQSALGTRVLARLGPIHPPEGAALALLVFAAQAVATRAWLARFRFGPVEWLWRSLAYGRVEPLRPALR